MVIKKDPSIAIRNISKMYKLFDSPEDRLKEALHPISKKYHKEYWALKDISLEILKGQTLGILGRNGSGKSTLLQIIAGILNPTSGSIQVNGRVSALLELGAGFNPEFTGRENAIFQAEMLGFQTEEIKKIIFDVEKFSDIGNFFDQPVKVYSSGMFVRVAFAAAINVDPEILIIDEALSVGDAEFQQKCFAKFREFQEKGVTIILVTHDMESVIRHCDRGVLLEKSRMVCDGIPKEVAAEYLNLLEGRKEISLVKDGEVKTKFINNLALKNISDSSEIINNFNKTKPSDDLCSVQRTYNKSESNQKSERVEIIDYLLVNNGDLDRTTFLSGEAIDIFIKVRFLDFIKRPCYGIALKTVDGITIYALNSAWTPLDPLPAEMNDYRIVHFQITLPLNSNDLFIDFGVDEKKAEGGYKNLTRRFALAHLKIQNHHKFDGIVDLNCKIYESKI